jgi:uncharacterized protein (TIGR03083 family)
VSGHSDVSSLLAAWTINACDTREAGAVSTHLRGCETCKAESRELIQAAAHLGSPALPPPSLRDKVNTAVRSPKVPHYASCYAATVAALDALLRELDANHWARVAHDAWTVLDLVIHLTATDNLIADRLGLHVHPPVRAGEDPAARTELLLAIPTDHAWSRWREQSAAICGALARKDLPPDLMAWHAFETWVHAHDIARATRKQFPPPPPDTLHAIADFTAHLLPPAAELKRIVRAGTVARLILTGAGGGTWTLPLAEPNLGVTVEITVDVIEFCLLMGARREPRAVDVMIRGDVELGHDLLGAGPALAPR